MLVASSRFSGVAIATITPVTPGRADTERETCMSFTESAYTPDLSVTERMPAGADGAPEGGETVTSRTVLTGLSAVKYRHLTAVTI
jgi:hypothetical protein